MFVLRSHEPDSGCTAQPDTEDNRVTTAEGEAARGERRGLRPDGPGRGRGGNESAKPDAAAADPTSTRTGEPRGVSMHMPLFAAAFPVRFGGPSAATECAKHLGDVQALIDKVLAGVDRARDRISSDRAALVHALLDDARMLLDLARHNHERPQGPYDHARAFAKADAALGHARAAQIVYSRSTHG